MEKNFKLKVTEDMIKDIQTYKSEIDARTYVIDSMFENHKDDKDYYGIKTSDLTQKLCITKPATSKILNIMEDKGYISRSSNKSDRRVVYVKLTEEGENFLREENIKFENFTYKIVEKMGEEDTDNLIRLFNKLCNVIEELQLEK